MSEAEAERAPSKESLRFSIAVTVAFAAYLIFAHAHHELWRDEMHNFLIARRDGFWQLLVGRRRYDGHPFLWYWLIHLLALFYDRWVILHVASIATSVAAAFVWLRETIFPRPLRLAFLATYYFGFEYTVISRMYVLGLLMLFLFCTLYDPKKPRYVLLSVLLASLFATSTYGAVIAACLALILFGTGLRRITREYLGGLAITASCFIVTTLASWPPSDALFTEWKAEVGWGSAVSASGRFLLGLFPIGRYGLEFWSNDLLLGVLPPILRVLLAPAMIIAFAMQLRRRPWIAASCLTGIAIMAAFQHAKYSGSVRHFGHYFVLMLACSWIFARTEGGLSRSLRLTWSAVFAVQIAGAAIAVASDFHYPFSSAPEAAEVMRAHNLIEMPKIGSIDHAVSNIAGLLDTKFTYAETDELTDAVTFHNRRQTIGPKEALAKAHALAIKEGRDVLLVLNYDLKGEALEGVTVELIHQTQPACVDEQYWIYRVGTLSRVEKARE